MVIGELDQIFIDSLNEANIKGIFADLVERKTDLLDGEVRIAKGSDGIRYSAFDRNIGDHVHIICTKGVSGKYCFAPLREIVVPKPPYEKDQLEQAKATGRIRTLSISTIQDTIFQELMNRVLSPYAEQKFESSIDLNSFAYRKGKSSKLAVKLIQNYISEGFAYVIDGDIEKFFDEIDHKILQEKIVSFFRGNPLLQKFIYRYMHTRRIPDGAYREYLNTGQGAIRRNRGIPQGGVLSGLLANIFLYDLDRYVIEVLRPIYHFQYIRYADDFVLMFKHKDGMEDCFNLIKEFLMKERLNLHPLGGKSKFVDVSQDNKESLEFLGFRISPKYLRVKGGNVQKFLHRIEAVIDPIDASDDTQYVSKVCRYLSPKVIGLEDLLGVEGHCEVCGQLLKKRNWMGYFMMIDDVRQLRDVDTSIRRSIYEDYHRKTKKHLRKKILLNANPSLLSLERTYYRYKKQERLVKQDKASYCNCYRHFDTDLGKIVVIPNGSYEAKTVQNK